MMVKFINKLTGSVMYVAESRVKEYTAAGHKPAAAPAKAPKQESAKAHAKKRGTAKKKAGA